MTDRAANRLIEGLPRILQRRLLNCCESVELAEGSALCGADEPYEYVYFPQLAYVSLVTICGAHAPLELGLIGNEGMLGATVALGITTAPARAVVQGGGAALRMTCAQFQEELRVTPVFDRAIGRYLYVIMAQLSQSAGCMRFHEVAPRLARWLLMIHDRAQVDQFDITHEVLGNMLGVRRSGITIAAGILQAQQLISYRRGRMRVLNRNGLEALACECYRATIDDYDQLLSRVR